MGPLNFDDCWELQETLAGLGSNGHSTGILSTFGIKFSKIK